MRFISFVILCVLYAYQTTSSADEIVANEVIASNQTKNEVKMVIVLYYNNFSTAIQYKENNLYCFYFYSFLKYLLTQINLINSKYSISKPFERFQLPNAITKKRYSMKTNTNSVALSTA